MNTKPETTNKSAKAVLVLGMHRSGTSAIAPAIQVLGFELGNNLMPPKPDNIKGFWEDWDVVDLNEAILRSDTGSWDRLSLFDEHLLPEEQLSLFVDRATVLLQNKFTGIQRFAIKDPRISLILPIWHRAFSNHRIEPFHILCLRHPSSVAQSLAKRNAIPENTALLLWLNHIYSILRDCQSPLLIVGYENLLRDPVHELMRIGRFLGVEVGPDYKDNENLLDFLEHGLDKGLDHSRVSPGERCQWLVLVDDLYHSLSQHHNSPPLDPKQQTHLLEEFHLDDKLFQELNRSAAEFRHEQTQLIKNEEALEEVQSLINSLQNSIQQLPYINSDGVIAAAELEKTNIELVALKADREKVDADRQRIDLERKKLLNISVGLQEDKQRLENELIDMRASIKKLEQKIIDSSSSFEKLTSVHISLERDYKNTKDQLNTIQRDYKDKKDQLNTVQKELHFSRTANQNANHLNQQLSHELHDLRLIKESRVWRMTAPIRWTLERLYHLPGIKALSRENLKIEPMNHIERVSEKTWKSIDHDPHFRILNVQYPVRAGVYKISFSILSGKELLAPIVYFDYGAGFREENSMSLVVKKQTAKALVRLTDPVYDFRLDPCEKPGIFSLDRVRWRRVSKPELLLRLARFTLHKYRAQGFTAREIINRGISRIRQEGLSNIWWNSERYLAVKDHLAEEAVSYEQWIELYEKPFHALRYGDTQINVSHSPYLFVVLHHDQDPSALPLTVESVKLQSVSTAPILILDAAKAGSKVQDTEGIQIFRDPRQFHDVMSEQARSGLYSHMVFLRAGHVLSPVFDRALALRLSEKRDADLIYSDSDELSAEGRRENPRYKPAWNPDFELASHYIGDTFTVSVKLVNEISTEWLLYKKDSLYALLASSIPSLSEHSVEHIPEILWHETETENEHRDALVIDRILTSSRLSESVAAIEDKDNSRGYRLQFRLPSLQPAVDIIIPTKDQSSLLETCINSIRERTKYQNYQIVVVDNDSRERSTLNYLDKLRDQNHCTVLSFPHLFNYSAINNFAVDRSQADIIILMNNDIEVISDNWLQELVSHATRPEVGCVGAKLYYPDGRVQHAGVVLGIHGVAGHVFRLSDRVAEGNLQRLKFPQNYSAVTGACLAVRRTLYQKLDGLNEKDLAVAFNDIDFCLRLRESGYLNVWTPYAELYHHESASRGEYDNSEKLLSLRQEAAYMTQRWGEWLINDPAYNPNLSLAGTDCELGTRYVGGVASQQMDDSVSISEHPYRAETNISRVNQVLKHSAEVIRKPRDYLPGLSIVILTLEKLELIQPLLESLISAQRTLKEEDGFDLQIVVGDTGSVNSSVHELYLCFNEEVTVVKNMKYHFSCCNNQLFKEHVLHETVLFLNNDVIFSDPVVSLMAMHNLLMNHDDIAIVGTYLLYPNKRLQHGGVDMFRSGELKGLCYHPHHNAEFHPPEQYKVEDVPAVTGACLMMKSNLFYDCSFFDESYQAEAQDVDLCLKARRIGKTVKLIYCGEIIHHENATRPKGDSNQYDRSRFIRKWKSFQEAAVLE